MRRHKHYLSHYRLYTGDMGELIPIGYLETLMADTFRHRTSVMLRVSPLARPVMHPVHIRVHHWFVPLRLIWDDWEDFITGKQEAPAITYPTITTPGTATYGTLLDHLGVDPAATSIEVSALPIRAYNIIYNEFYRDQDLHAEVALDDTALKRASWEKDYFTTARPSAQQGDTVQVPLSGVGTQAPVLGIGPRDTVSPAAGFPRTVKESSGSTRSYTTGFDVDTQAFHVEEKGSTGFPNVYADLGTGVGIDINDLRFAFAEQRIREARSRYGSRYVDYLRYMGVRPSDGRLDRPEYLGGGRQTVAFSEVLATAEGVGTNVGDLRGHGIAAVRTRPYRRFFEEHGIVLTLATVRPRAIYSEALHRSWLRRKKEDYWDRSYELQGQQEVKKREIWARHPNDTDVFGYVDQSREYREHPSYVSGTFRSTDDSWHMSRAFGASPELNASFVECNPTNRIYQDTTMKQLYMMAQHQIVARRLVSKRARG